MTEAAGLIVTINGRRGIKSQEVENLHEAVVCTPIAS